MLIKITQSCSMGCSHCCNDAVPCDRHMTMETFIDVLNFINKNDTYSIHDMFAGGEPFENPLFWNFVDKYFEMIHGKMLIIATNGIYMQKHQEEVAEKLEKYKFLCFQVTNDTRYYPQKLDVTKRIFRHERVWVTTKLDHLVPKGRAIINHPNEVGLKNKVPVCINLKLVALQFEGKGQLKDILRILRINNKQCIPCIQYNGDIGFGEYDGCPGFVSIYQSEQEILDAILNFKCKGCPEMWEKMVANIDTYLPKEILKKYKDKIIGT